MQLLVCLALVVACFGSFRIAFAGGASPALGTTQPQAITGHADSEIRFRGNGSVHRHFGDIVVGRSGKIIGIHRRASEHGVKGSGEIVYYTSEDAGRTFSDETVLAPSTMGRDKRDVAMGTSPTGRILVVWTDTAISGGRGPTHFRSSFSDNDGTSWSTARTFATIPYGYARAYGTVKSIVRADGKPMLAVPAYFRVNDDPDYRVTMYYSRDDGETWFEGAPIHQHDRGESDSVYTETDHVWLDGTTAFSVSRSDSGMGVFRTRNGGASWDQIGVIRSKPKEDAVGPAAYLLNFEAKKYLLVFYCDRRSNTTRVRWTSISPLLKGEIGDLVKNLRILSPADMVNASGYQKVAFLPDGMALMVEFVEKSGGDRSSDVRLVWLAPREWIEQRIGMEGKRSSVRR